MNVLEFYRYKEKVFDSFCKVLIRNASVDSKRKIFHQFNREILFTDLPQKEIENLSQLGLEETPPLKQTTLFRVQGETVQIEDRALGKAMQYLMPEQRDIVLLHYFRHFNDRAIADLLHCSADTVRLRRQKALQQLRRELETMLDLEELTAKNIQQFYLEQRKRVSVCTVIHYHAIIHKALKCAVKLDLIATNPADRVERPKKERYVASFYDADEVNALFQAARGTNLEIPILLGAFYGLRRSEVIGLKWDAIDFERNNITVQHTVTSCNVDGKNMLVAADRTKTKSSMRTLPLVPFMKERLLQQKKVQAENRKLCGRSYVKDYLGYVCVNEIGAILKPNYISTSFPKLLETNGLRHIRFHDLRHPYVKHTTKIFSLRLKVFQAQPVPDALRKTRRAFQQPFPYEQNGLPKQTVL